MNTQRSVALCRCADTREAECRCFHAPTGLRLSDRRTAAAVSIPVEHGGNGPVDVPVRNVNSILRDLDFDALCQGAQCTSDDKRVAALVSAKPCRPSKTVVCTRTGESLLLCRECTEHYLKRGGVCACGRSIPARFFRAVWL